jgi:hypothetical protein
MNNNNTLNTNKCIDSDDEFLFGNGSEDELENEELLKGFIAPQSGTNNKPKNIRYR